MFANRSYQIHYTFEEKLAHAREAIANPEKTRDLPPRNRSQFYKLLSHWLRAMGEYFDAEKADQLMKQYKHESIWQSRII
jgi:hypothetical protein